MRSRTSASLLVTATGLLLAGCGGSGGATTGAVQVVSGATTSVAAPPASVPTPMPAPAAKAQASQPSEPVATPLPPLDLSDMRLWNWGGRWHASEWNNGMSPIPWRHSYVTQQAGGDTLFRLDASGAPQLQAMGGTSTFNKGMWEADVTLPQLREGLIVAPLWLWDSESRDEIDFELAGRGGLDVSLHSARDGQMQRDTVRLFAGRDMSGERHRFGINIDDQAGLVDMFLDGVLVHRWERSKMSFFVSRPLKPMIEMWAADPNNSGFVYWAGRWAGMAESEALTMTVHGFGYRQPTKL